MILRWLPRARKNRKAAIDFIARDNIAAALDQLSRLEDQIDNLSIYPELGKVGRQAGTRELIVAHTPWIVVYRIRPKLGYLEILRILHSSQKHP
ncbi:type II toxin-antitoxin system RelE/ParE family toxin [Thalassospira sp.]|uniref:type II toxin-antitoxin system RelE/ParE family toxin n=1 Tax=Thalassospira sp. TaxID=1912094 RepID=UPI002735F75A|nr:type II toxin-antitoxin system RelE/ParE family toxin [Thalassospira sp.]MDP2699410.1 type II toxin-antitoxin system RelE/ParE family toxin [Thalassospira sp.]